jgi:hypothetical protein
MKKLLTIILLIFLISCTKTVPTPAVDNTVDLFNKPQITVSGNVEVKFDVPLNGTYTLTLKDSATNQVVTRERFKGVMGTNKLVIYTKTLNSKYLYVSLEDINRSLIGKTLLIIQKN